MKVVRGLFVALSLLVAVWSLLAAVAWAFDALPPITGGFASRPAPAADAGVEAPAPVDAGTDAPSSTTDSVLAEGTAQEDSAPEASPPVPPLAWQVCPAGTTHHRAWIEDVVGSARAEFVVACGAVLDAYALDEDGEYFAPRRVLSISTDIPAGSSRIAPLVSAVAAGDFVGSEARDLAVGFRDADPMSTSGGVVVFAGTDGGFFERPNALASIPVADLRSVRRVGPGVRDQLAVLNAGQEIARRPAEIWFYEPGTVLVRRQVLRTTVGASRLGSAPTWPEVTGPLFVHAPVARAFGMITWTGTEWALGETLALASEFGTASMGQKPDEFALFSLGAASSQLVRDGVFLQNERAAILDGAKFVVRNEVEGSSDLVGVYDTELRPLVFDAGALRLDADRPIVALPQGFPRVAAAWWRDVRRDGKADLVLLVHGTTSRGPALVLIEDFSFESTIVWSEEVPQATDAPLVLRMLVR